MGVLSLPDSGRGQFDHLQNQAREGGALFIEAAIMIWRSR